MSTATIPQDANSFLATTLTTLNNVPTNANIQINADVGDFDLYSQTKLQNSILYTTLESQGYTQLNSSGADLTNVVIQWANTNWVDTHDMYLMVNVEMTATAIKYFQLDTTPAYLDPIFANNPEVIGYMLTEGAFKQETQYIPYAKFDSGIYYAGGLLNCFTKIECVGGTNNQQLGRSTMYPQPYLSLLGSSIKVDENEAFIRGRVGMPFSNCSWNGINMVANNLSILQSNGDSVTTANTRTIQSYIKGFESLVRQASAIYGGTASQDGKTYTNTFAVAIPLRMISEFYQIKKVLPPEFKHRMTFQVKTTPTLLYANDPDALQPATPTREGGTWFVKLDPSSFQIQMRTQVLTPSLQEQFNIKWQANPLVFDIATNDTWSFSSYPYQQTIVTSYTRPNTIAIMAIANQDRIINAPGVQNAIALRKNTLSPFIAADGSTVRIQRVRLTLSGRNAIDIDLTLSQSNNYMIPVGFEQIVNTLNSKCLRLYTGSDAHNDTNQGPFNSGGSLGKIIYIPFTPSQYWDINTYPVDMGSVQLRLEVITDKALHPAIDLQVLKTVVDQYTVNSNNQLTLITWPKRVLQTGGAPPTLLNKTVVPAN
jgi:hypothetical protein